MCCVPCVLGFLSHVSCLRLHFLFAFAAYCGEWIGRVYGQAAYALFVFDPGLDSFSKQIL